jgi:hypothetical protein
MSHHRIDSPNLVRDAIPALVVLTLALLTTLCAATVSLM